jgi:hypothetical protein
METEKFEIGDEVEYISDIDNGHVSKGWKGIYVHKHIRGSYGIDWYDMPIGKGHTLEMHIDENTGWYVNSDEIKLVSSKEPIFNIF